MKIELDNSEITEAIVKYIVSQGIPVGEKSISVNMVAGRGERGVTALVDISGKESSKPTLVSDSTLEPEESNESTTDTKSGSSVEVF